MNEQIDDFNRILQSFKIKARCVNYKRVRNISLFDLRLAPGTLVKEIDKYASEIALALKAKNEPITRVITELGVVRVEIIDGPAEKVDYYEQVAKINKSGKLPMYLGDSIDGEPVITDFARNPHLLIAGSTGSGKSSLLNTIIANVIDNKEIETYIIDSKGEFNIYEEMRGNIFIANNYDKAYDIVEMLYEEMENRYNLMKDKFRFSSMFGMQKESNPILLIIDEYAEIHMADENKIFEQLLIRLTQRCRAANIFVVLATQRPSTDILKGTLRAQFSARIACRVASRTDSKMILDQSGAEHLGGAGDAIIVNYENDYRRFQVAYTGK
jgi:DNA segregation ATPase FtsK/SpoIIIE, S-DNA-T family